MPRLPDVGALGQRSPIGLRRGFAQQDTEAAGIGMARFGAVAANTGFALADEAERKQTITEASAAKRALDDWERAAVWGDGGAASKLGKDAAGVPDAVLKSYDDAAGKIGRGLTTRGAREAFQALATSRRAQIGDWASKHALQQGQIADRQSAEADVASAQDRALRWASADPSPEGVAKARSEMAIAEQRQGEYLRSVGTPLETVALRVKESSSKVHAGIVASILKSGDYKAAEAYLTANAPSMTKQDELHAKDQLREVVSLGKAQASVEEALDKGLKGQDAVDYVRKKFTTDPVTQERAASAMKTRLAEFKAADAERSKALTGAVWDQVLKPGGKLNLTAPEWTELRQVAPGHAQDVERQIKDWQLAKWRQYEAIAKDKANDPSPSKTAEFLRLADMATSRPWEFADVDLARVEPYVTPRDFDRLKSLRMGVNKAEAKDLEKRNKQLGINKMMDATVKSIKSELQSAGFDLTPPEGSSKAKKLAEFQAELRRELIDASMAGPVDEQQMYRIGMKLVGQGIEQGSGIGGWFETKKRGYEIAAERRANEATGKPQKNYIVAKFGEIPAATRDEIIADQFPQAQRSIYGKREPILTDEQKAVVEAIYTRGREVGRFR